MGGKARQAFQVVLWGAAMYASGGAWGAYAGYALAGVSTVYGAWAAREERKKAESALNNNAFQEQRVILRGGAIAKSYVYGHAYVNGVVVGGRSPKSKEDPYFWIVLALPVAHKIHHYAQIMFGESNLAPLKPNGDVADGRFHRVFQETHTQSGIVPDNKLIDLKPKPGHTGEPIYVLGEMEGSPITIAQQLSNAWEGMPAMTTGDDTWQDQRRAVQNNVVTYRRVPGMGGAGNAAYNPTLIELVGATTGHRYSITYKYQYTKSYIKAWAYYGDENQQADPNFIWATRDAGLFEQKWTASDRLRGIPHVVFRIHPDPDVFPRGFEPITFLIAGKVDMVDPRHTGVHYSSNPVICIRDYLIKEFGADPAETDDSGEIIAQANICDDAIPLDASRGIPNQYPGYTDANPHQERYRLDIALSTENTPLDNLGLMLTACDGAVVPSGATLDIWAGHFPTPEIELEDSDFVSFPEVVKGLARPELFNSIRARHRNDHKYFWPMEEAQPYQSRHYALQDNFGQEPPRYIWREIDLPGTRDPYMAHRISKQMLHRARNGLRLAGVLNTRAIPLAPEQTFFYRIRSLGMIRKVFRVKTFKALPNGTVELEAQEDAPQLYEWNFDEVAFDPTPNTSLPDPTVVPKIQNLRAFTNLQAAAIGPNGELQGQCQVIWDEIQDPLVLASGHVDVRYKRSHELTFNYSPRISPNQEEYRFPVRYGDVLTIEARMSNRLVAGEWTTIEKTADDTPTGYLTGNLLINPRFFYQHQFDGDTVDIEYTVEGWTGPWDAGNISLMPYKPMLLDNPLSGNFGDDPGHLGYIYWLENDPAVVAPLISWFCSNKIPVKAGERMVTYVWGHSYWQDLRIDIVWFDNTGAEMPRITRYISDTMRTRDQPGAPIFADDPSHLYPLGGFMTVPEGATAAIMSLAAFRGWDDNGNYWPSSRTGMPVWFQPYFGRASKNQVVWPPWNG